MSLWRILSLYPIRGLLLAALLFFIYSVSPGGISTLPSLWESYSFQALREFLTYHIYLAATFSLGFFARGPINRLLIAIYGGTLLLEYFLHFSLHSWADGHIYWHSSVGTIVSAVTLLVFIIRKPVMRKMAKMIGRTGRANGFAKRCFELTLPTNLELSIINVCRWYFILELCTTLYQFGYGWVMGIPSSGSIYQTILSNNHIDYFPISAALTDVVGLWWIFIAFKTLTTEQSNPDALGRALKQG